VVSVRESAERLFDRDAMKHLGQEGRDDHIVALPPGEVQRDTERYGSLVVAARVLMSLPSMIMQGGQQDGDTSAAAREKFETCTPPPRLMLSRYPPSAGRYVAHIDNDPADPNYTVGTVGLRAVDRTYTCILYLNDGWEPEHEGHLRLHHPSKSADVEVAVVEGADYTDVEPRGGRLVIFDSKLMLHEVRPSFAPRWAISAWI